MSGGNNSTKSNPFATPSVLGNTTSLFFGKPTGGGNSSLFGTIIPQAEGEKKESGSGQQGTLTAGGNTGTSGLFGERKPGADSIFGNFSGAGTGGGGRMFGTSKPVEGANKGFFGGTSGSSFVEEKKEKPLEGKYNPVSTDFFNSSLMTKKEEEEEKESKQSRDSSNQLYESEVIDSDKVFEQKSTKKVAKAPEYVPQGVKKPSLFAMPGIEVSERSSNSKPFTSLFDKKEETVPQRPEKNTESSWMDSKKPWGADSRASEQQAGIGWSFGAQSGSLSLYQTATFGQPAQSSKVGEKEKRTESGAQQPLVVGEANKSGPATDGLAPEPESEDDGFISEEEKDEKEEKEPEEGSIKSAGFVAQPGKVKEDNAPKPGMIKDGDIAKPEQASTTEDPKPPSAPKVKPTPQFVYPEQFSSMLTTFMLSDISFNGVLYELFGVNLCSTLDEISGAIGCLYKESAHQTIDLNAKKTSCRNLFEESIRLLLDFKAGSGFNCRVFGAKNKEVDAERALALVEQIMQGWAQDFSKDPKVVWETGKQRSGLLGRRGKEEGGKSIRYRPDPDMEEGTYTSDTAFCKSVIQEEQINVVQGTVSLGLSRCRFELRMLRKGVYLDEVIKMPVTHREATDLDSFQNLTDQVVSKAIDAYMTSLEGSKWMTEGAKWLVKSSMSASRWRVCPEPYLAFRSQPLTDGINDLYSASGNLLFFKDRPEDEYRFLVTARDDQDFQYQRVWSCPSVPDAPPTCRDLYLAMMLEIVAQCEDPSSFSWDDFMTQAETDPHMRVSAVYKGFDDELHPSELLQAVLIELPMSLSPGRSLGTELRAEPILQVDEPDDEKKYLIVTSNGRPCQVPDLGNYEWSSLWDEKQSKGLVKVQENDKWSVFEYGSSQIKKIENEINQPSGNWTLAVFKKKEHD